MTCSIDGCERVARYPKLGLCGKHYERLRLYGTTDDPPKRPGRVTRPGDPRPFSLEPLLRKAGRYQRVTPGAQLYKDRERPERRSPDAVWGHAPGSVSGEDPHQFASPRRILTEVCGLTRREYLTAKEAGALTEEQADQCAARLNMHPSAIWGDLWRQATAEAIASEERALFEQIRREVAA